jgi:hypothetical protein
MGGIVKTGIKQLEIVLYQIKMAILFNDFVKMGMPKKPNGLF